MLLAFSNNISKLAQEAEYGLFAVWYVRQIQEVKCWLLEHENLGGVDGSIATGVSTVFMLFIDLRKAYDSIPREALWRVLAKYGVPCYM